MGKQIGTIQAWLVASAAASALVLGLGAAALAQASKTCVHEGKTYQAGEKLVIDGKKMVCDGATGTWVASH